jgi:hypothetical protein
VNLNSFLVTQKLPNFKDTFWMSKKQSETWIRDREIGGWASICLALLAISPLGMDHVQAQGTQTTPAEATAASELENRTLAANWSASTVPVPPATAPPVEVTKAEPPKPSFEMVDAAARYVALVKEADRMTFPNALASESIASSLMITARLSSKEITEGVGAYATLAVANDPAFKSGLQTAMSFLGRDVALARLKENPASFLTMISGYGDATKIASGAIEGSMSRLEAAQTTLNAAAYSLQKERWATQEVDTQSTLAAHRSSAVQPSGLTPFAMSDLPARPSESPVNSRYVLAAAYRLLGDEASAIELLDKPLGRMCMNRVQLNVRQCIAASRFAYEHAFCLSQHSFGESLTCVKSSVR